MTDPSLHLALLVFGRVVVTIFLEVAKLAGRLDDASDVVSTMGYEVLMFGGKAVECSLGELVDLWHPNIVAR